MVEAILFISTRSNLRVELSQKVKVLLQVCGQDGFDDQEAEALELHVIQVDQKVEFRTGKVEAPGGGGVVVLQHGSVVVEHGLKGETER